MPITIDNEARSFAHLFAEPDTDAIDLEDWQTFAYLFVGLGVTIPSITPPLVVFIAPLREMAVTSTIDLLSWAATARAMAITSQARNLIFPAPVRTMAVVSTIDILHFTAPARPMAVVSAARGGG